MKLEYLLNSNIVKKNLKCKFSTKLVYYIISKFLSKTWSPPETQVILLSLVIPVIEVLLHSLIFHSLFFIFF